MIPGELLPEPGVILLNGGPVSVEQDDAGLRQQFARNHWGHGVVVGDGRVWGDG